MIETGNGPTERVFYRMHAMGSQGISVKNVISQPKAAKDAGKQGFPAKNSR